MENSTIKNLKIKLTPEQLFEIYQECSSPQAPVKSVLERHGLKPWDLVAIRKRIKEAALEALAHPTRKGKKATMISLDQYQRSIKELQETKDALSAVGHELSLLKKRVN